MNGFSKEVVDWQGQDSAESGVSFAVELLDAIVQYKVGACVLLLLILVGGVSFALISPSIYTADALIQVEDKKANPVPGVQQLAQALNVGENNIVGELDILRSREVVGRAIDALKLDILVTPLNRVPVFADAFERHVGGRGIFLAPPRFDLSGYEWGGETVTVSEMDVPTFFLGRSFVLTVLTDNSWTLSDSEGATLASGLVGSLTYYKLGNGTGALLVNNFLARHGNKFVITKLSKIDAYRRITGGLAATETARQSGVIRVTYSSDDPNQAAKVLNEIAAAYVDQNVSRGSEDASKALAFLQQQLPQSKRTMEASEEALSKYQISRQSISLDKEAGSLLDRSVDLGKAKLDANMKRGQLLQVFKADHPQVQAIDQEIKQIDAQEAELAGEVKRLPDTQQGLLALSRDMKINTDIYTALLSSAEQYKVAKAGTIGNVRIVDSAVAPPLPTKPNRKALVGISFAIGILAAIGYALLRRALQPSFRSADELERKLGVPVYGTVPESKFQSGMFVRRKVLDKSTRVLHELAPTDVAVESLRSMNVALQFALADAPNKNILITGPTASLGKSFIAANLAAVLGAAGKKVLLIETDMRRPRLHQYFGVTLSPGLSEVLAVTAKFANSVRSDVITCVDLLPAGHIPPNPSELLVNGRISALLGWAQDKYDLVILDSPPLLPVGDAVIVSKHVGAVFLVLRFEQSSPAQALEAMRRLENVGSKVKGIIFNGLKLDRLRYGYQYRQYYEYK